MACPSRQPGFDSLIFRTKENLSLPACGYRALRTVVTNRSAETWDTGSIGGALGAVDKLVKSGGKR